MYQLLNALKAAGEETRLRILALLRQGELTVSELTQILRQSQPRVSRHLKLLCEAGLLDRHPEGTWVFYRLSDQPGLSDLARMIIAAIPENDPDHSRDMERLRVAMKARAAIAAAYFEENAADWDRLRTLHVPETEVERRLSALIAGEEIDDFLDIGTGTGRMLELFSRHIRRGIGVDLSHPMLQLARTRLEQAGLDHCQVRLGDMYSLPFDDESQDCVLFHQVLHYAGEPQAAIVEAARLLRPGKHLIVADFAPHTREELRTQHAHHRLGFSEDEVAHWAADAGLAPRRVEHLSGGELTVTLWHFVKAPAQETKQKSRRLEIVS